MGIADRGSSRGHEGGVVNEKVLALLDKYDAFLATFGVEPHQCVDRPASQEAMIRHLRYMVRTLSTRAEPEGWSERKVNRWLGFMQGVMWTLGYKGLSNLRDDCRHLYEDERARALR